MTICKVGQLQIAVIVHYALFICAVHCNKSPLVTVEQGTLQGLELVSVMGKPYFAFQGIPFAKPPIGDLRFKITRKFQERFSKRNYEIHGLLFSARGTVYHPMLPAINEPLRAVMVWIHGGAFRFGSTKKRMTGPDFLLQENVVVVSIQYRLGILGFLSLKDVGIPGNNGLKDQVMALKWVQNNIAQFGGDPEAVTIFGESAGGASVHYHLLSPMSAGLFQRAISQSGSALNRVWAYDEPHEIRYRSIQAASLQGCNHTDTNKILQCLQKLTAEELIQMDQNLEGFAYFRPTREDYIAGNEDVFLPGKPEDLVSAGKFHNVPYISGTNLKEGSLFSRFLPGEKLLSGFLLAEGYVKDHQKVEKMTEKVFEFYFSNAPDNTTALTDAYTDVAFVLGTYETLKKHAARSTAPVYGYLFSFDGLLASSYQVTGYKMTGPSHGDEYGYLFHIDSAFDKPGNNSYEMKTLFRMCKMWTNFAKTGDPSSDMNDLLNVKWKPIINDKNAFMIIDQELKMKNDPHRIRMKFWEELMLSENN